MFVSCRLEYLDYTYCKVVGLGKDYPLVQNNNSDEFERARNSVEKFLMRSYEFTKYRQG